MATGGLTKARQETAVGEGLALGCLVLDVVAVTSEKMAVEFAFSKAWRDWPPASRFPAVHATLSRHDLLRILHDSPRRRDSYLAEWSTSGPEYQPLLRGCWEVAEAGELLEGWSGVALRSWVELARVFINDFGDKAAAPRSSPPPEPGLKYARAWSLHRGSRHPAQPAASRRQTGACYPALRNLPITCAQNRA